MFCLNDKCYCQRSKKDYCEKNGYEPCKNVLCSRHAYEIINPNDFPICYSDFGDTCKDYLKEVEPAPCPMCHSNNLKIYARLINSHYNDNINEFIGNYVFKIKCECGLKYDGVKVTNLKVGNKEDIDFGKLAVILKWNKRYNMSKE